MSDQRPGSAVQRFHATNGRASGYLGLGVGVLVLGLAIAGWGSDRAPGVAILALLGLLLVWVVMLRPALWVNDRDLVLRGMYHTDVVPLAAIERVAVGQVTAVTAGGKRYLSPVVGYSARQTIKQRRGAKTPDTGTGVAADTYQVFVEERITHLAGEARELHGAEGATPRRTYAWPEIAGTTVLVVAFLVWLLAI